MSASSDGPRWSLTALAVLGLFLAVVVSPSQATAEPMRFAIETRDGDCAACVTIVAQGEITPSTPADFQRFIEAHRPSARSTIAFASPGGSLSGAVELGELIRRSRYRTMVASSVAGELVPSDCASACAYAFLGGRARSLLDGSRIGLHQFSAATLRGDPISETQSVVALVSALIRNSGASPEVLEIASSVSPDQVLWLGPREAFALGISTIYPLRPNQWTFHSGTRLRRIEAPFFLADDIAGQVQISCTPRAPSTYFLAISWTSRRRPSDAILAGIEQFATSTLRIAGSRMGNYDLYGEGTEHVNSWSEAIPCTTGRLLCFTRFDSTYVALESVLSREVFAQLAAAARRGAPISWAPNNSELEAASLTFPEEGLTVAISTLESACAH